MERGESIILGVGLEDDEARGTGVDSQIWIPSVTPNSIIQKVEKVLVEETKATKSDSYGSEAVKKWIEGELEMNIRTRSIGYLLKSLLGSCSSAAKASPNDAVYDHTFSVNTGVQNPSLTLDVQRTTQAYRYALALVSKLDIEITLDGLVKAVASFVGKSEAEHAQFSPSFASTDRYLRHQDTTIKIASDVAGLDAASALELKDLSLSIENKARVDHVIGALTPDDTISPQMSVSGKISGTYTAKTNYDSFKDGDYYAMRIDIERNDVTIGSDQHPKLRITLPRISFEEYDLDRPMEDVLKEGIDFKAHYDETETKLIEAVLTNLITAYDHA